jgi:hypothetical protein
MSQSTKRGLKVTALGVLVVAVALVLGAREGVKAQALQAHGSSTVQRSIFPVGGTDGPP